MVVVIDPQNSGIAGNMVLGALVDMGLNPENLIEVMEHYASYFGDISVNVTDVKKSGISATYVDVECHDKEAIRYTELLERLDKIKHEEVLPDVLKFAKRIFRTIADAESKVHGTTIQKVHFHEVGAADAVADIIGASYGFHKLDFNSKKVYGMPVALGGGRIKSKHGILSVPAPATLEILKNVPVFGGPVDYELTTPTGASIFVNMVDEFCSFYPIIVNRKIGYGAGKHDLEIPNLLRIIEGDSQVPTDNVSILETNLDNVTGEVIGHMFQKLLEVGARDVTVIPTLTKKNRPGHLLRVITKPSDCDKISEAIIRETGTLGVRVLPYVHRNITSRKIIPVEVDINGIKREIRIKVGTIGDEIISSKVEYEDAKKLAQETGISLKDVMLMADEAFRKSQE